MKKFIVVSLLALVVSAGLAYILGGMEAVKFTVLDVAMLVGIVYGMYLWGRIQIPVWAEKDGFFCSPKLGRIKARRRAGRIISFLDNLVGKGKHVNKDTGKIEPGEVPPTGFWWNLFGVQYIGLDDVYSYSIATEAAEGADGELAYKTEMASSIYYENSFPLVAILMTKDGIRLKVKFRLKMTTRDAAKALSLPISWSIPVFAAVYAASRDFFGARKTMKLITLQNERGRLNVRTKVAETSEFIELILSLNETGVGNISLEDICGQHIDAVSIVDIDFFDEATRALFNAPFAAAQKAQEVVLKSEGDLKAADNTAQATTKKGEAVNAVLANRLIALGGDSEAVAEIEVADRQVGMPLTTSVRIKGKRRGLGVQLPIGGGKP